MIYMADGDKDYRQFEAIAARFAGTDRLLPACMLGAASHILVTLLNMDLREPFALDVGTKMLTVLFTAGYQLGREDGQDERAN
jgi:hypothetical protein